MTDYTDAKCRESKIKSIESFFKISVINRAYRSFSEPSFVFSGGKFFRIFSVNFFLKVETFTTLLPNQFLDANHQPVQFSEGNLYVYFMIIAILISIW